MLLSYQQWHLLLGKLLVQVNPSKISAGNEIRYKGLDFLMRSTIRSKKEASALLPKKVAFIRQEDDTGSANESQIEISPSHASPWIMEHPTKTSEPLISMNNAGSNLLPRSAD